MLKTAIYSAGIILSATAFELGTATNLHGAEMASLTVLFVLMPFACGLAGAVAAMIYLPVRISVTGMAGFALFYMFSCALMIVGLLPIAPIIAAQSIFSERNGMAAGLVLVFLSFVVAGLSLYFARWCLVRFSRTTIPSLSGRVLLWPALTLSVATIAPLAPRIYEVYLESDHVHITGHGPSMPTIVLILLSATPGLALILCHDSLFRQALDFLFRDRVMGNTSGLAWLLARMGLALGVAIVLGINILMFHTVGL